MTMTSNDVGMALTAGLLARDRKNRKSELAVFHVKQRSQRGTALFHVKQVDIEMNKEILLSYTKFPEDHVQDVFHIYPAQQAPERLRGHSQILGGKFLTLLDCVDAALQ
jgi:hypothetical protein